MKICKLEDCNKKQYSKEYCLRHYVAIKCDRYKCKEEGCLAYISFENYCSKHKRCSVENCTDSNYYAKGYCRNHYTTYVLRKDGVRIGKSCDNKQCNKTTLSSRSHCARCQSVVDKGLDPNIPHHGVKGENNYNWNGGSSEYKNHSEMKRMKLFKIDKLNCKCEDCGEQKIQKQLEAHHKDGSKDDHSYENLLILCKKCHLKAHGGSFKPKKKFNGLTLLEIASKVGCSYGIAWRHVNGQGSNKRYGEAINQLIGV